MKQTRAIMALGYLNVDETVPQKTGIPCCSTDHQTNLNEAQLLMEHRLPLNVSEIKLTVFCSTKKQIASCKFQQETFLE